MPRRVFAETAITGGRWRRRRSSCGFSSSSRCSVTSHLDRTTIVEHCDFRATSATARSPSVIPVRASTSTSATSARSAASSVRSSDQYSIPCRCLRLRRIPAVSTSTNVVSSRRSTVSIASRVVPGTSETMTRSSPTSRFRSEDLPTFGRPRMATRTAASSTSGGRSGASSRSRSTTSSRRSPVPCPWRLEIANGSPRPSRWNTWITSSRAGSSTLFATSSTGLRERRSRSAISSSPGVMPCLASTRKSTRSASSTAARACSAIRCVIADSSATSIPPVSTRTKRERPHSHTSSFRSRVTPGVSWTTAVRVA